MSVQQPDPSSLVRVDLNPGEPVYLRLAIGMYGDGAGRWWKDLGDLLYGRAGWYCEIDGEMAMIWSFGAVGSSLFNISYDGGPGYTVFDFEADSDAVFPTIVELRQWLDENEGRHADHPLKLRPLVSSSNWATLKQLPFDIDVTFADGHWITTVRRLPVTMSAEASLADSIRHSREAIARAFGAPDPVARDIQIRAHLDTAAAAALMP